MDKKISVASYWRSQFGKESLPWLHRLLWIAHFTVGEYAESLQEAQNGPSLSRWKV